MPRIYTLQEIDRTRGYIDSVSKGLALAALADGRPAFLTVAKYHNALFCSKADEANVIGLEDTLTTMELTHRARFLTELRPLNLTGVAAMRHAMLVVMHEAMTNLVEECARANLDADDRKVLREGVNDQIEALREELA